MVSKYVHVTYGRSVMSAHILEVSLLGVGTVFRLERDAWSMVKGLLEGNQQITSPLPVQRRSVLLLKTTFSIKLARPQAMQMSS